VRFGAATGGLIRQRRGEVRVLAGGRDLQQEAGSRILPLSGIPVGSPLPGSQPNAAGFRCLTGCG
jgi:hypothetical protein